MSSVLNITHSVTGQSWKWRSGDVDARDPGFQPDDLVTQLLLARGVPRDDIGRHRDPTIRGSCPIRLYSETWIVLLNVWLTL